MSMRPVSRSGRRDCQSSAARSERAATGCCHLWWRLKDHRRRDSGFPHTCTFNTSGCFVGDRRRDGRWCSPSRAWDRYI